MNISEKLTQLRKSKGYSQEELAEKNEVSRQAVSRWENGTALPDATNILALSKLYNVTADYLLNDDYKSDDDLPKVKEEKKHFTQQSDSYRNYCSSRFSKCVCSAVGRFGKRENH